MTFDAKKISFNSINLSDDQSLPRKTPISSNDSVLSENGFTPERIKVIVASSLGAIFEWYDFYIYASLAPDIGKQFFASLPPNSQFMMALIVFAAGLAFRPAGAILFGYLGDRIGRKYTFLMTIIIMGTATFLVGVLPTYQTIGVGAPIILMVLRCSQGLAVGGEYGGAATYVAEHAPHGKRGFYTGVLQSTSSAGFFLSVIVIIICRSVLQAESFAHWGWRIPFLISILLLFVSIFIRLKLSESPIFAQLKEDGLHSKSPLRESYCDCRNVLIMLMALFGCIGGQAVISYSSHLYVFYFLTQTLKIETQTVNLMLASMLLLAIIECFLWGWFSDRVGRKPVIMIGTLLACITIYPLYMSFTHFGNPALEKAMRESPVTVIADPGDCSFALIPPDLKSHIKLSSSCDLLKNGLNLYGISYTNVGAPKGTVAKAIIGRFNVTSVDIWHMNESEANAAQTQVNETLMYAIHESGYPLTADPNQMNIPMLLLMWSLIITFNAMTYGSLAAWIVELFPTRIRYTSLSLPYHIGNGWLGGFLPTIGFALILYTGNIYAGCYYPIIVAAITFVVGMLCLRETKGIDISSNEEHDILGEMPIINLVKRCKKQI